MTPLDTLKAVRRGYPTPMTNDQLGEMLNAVAWTHRGGGYGLLAKPTGSNCHQPQTGTLVSRDILCVVDDGQLRLYDVLVDAEGAAKPIWQPKKSLSDLSRWTAPVDASIALPPVEPPPPARPGVPSYPGDHAGVQLLQQLFVDYEAAGQGPDPGMGTWLLRIVWDVCNPPHLTAAQSLEKHRAEWLAILGSRG